MATSNQLESSLEDIFVKKAPKLPNGGKKFLVQYLPWLTLIGGILTLWSAWGLWHWAHLANNLIDYANSISRIYGNGDTVGSRLSVGIWLGIIVLVVEGLLYLAAFPGLRDRKKVGWNYLYYAALINIVYGVVILFTSYGGVGNLIGAIIGSAIGLWLLFQIRSSYSGTKSTNQTADSSK